MPSAPPGYTPPKIAGLGDAVALLAQPVARLIDAVAGTSLQGCQGCAGRKAWLNEVVPFTNPPHPEASADEPPVEPPTP
jgi:hypothetical protein